MTRTNPCRRAARRGQATTEWLLLVAVVAVAVVAAAYPFARTFFDEMDSLSDQAGAVYTTGALGGR